MDRRQFIGSAAAAGALLALGDAGRALAAGGAPDLVAAKGGLPDALFDRAIEELGGMKAFVKKGQKVLVKPNIGWDVGPERAANTNPALVARIVEQCLAAGAKEVYVFDHACDDGRRAYRTSGIEAAASAAGAKVAPAYDEGAYQKVKVPGKVLKEAKVHGLLLEADVFINVPILKHHSSSDLTIGMKNLMGVVWDRSFWHRNDLMQCISDMTGFRKPDLTVVDAYRVLKRYGPRGIDEEDVVELNAQLLSRDPVAADAAAAKLFGAKPTEAPYIRIAADDGWGRRDLEKLNVKKVQL
ncbi:MAG TPA: DUF362 domain-containing protein [Anaeromyxobacter sp.]|nr:DUF362 domain-containing protein [Anaeromyxobacter sp.]